MEQQERHTRNIYYVSARKAYGKIKIAWEVKREKSTRVQKLCQTKADAITYATKLAQKTKAIVLVYKTNGGLDQKIWFEYDQNSKQWLAHSHKYQSKKPKTMVELNLAN